jgi:hypothetical protein
VSDLKLLHAKIGQLMLENDFLESALNGILPDGSATSEELALMRLVDGLHLHLHLQATECFQECSNVKEAYPVSAVYHR